jgi:hypothetical protein
VLGPVAGRGEGGDRDVAEGHPVAVAQGLVREIDACRNRDVDRRARRFREPPLPGDVVGMVVRLENVSDRKAMLLGEPTVVFHLPFRVDHGRRAAVCDDVRGTAEILVEHLSEEHARPDHRERRLARERRQGRARLGAAGDANEGVVQAESRSCGLLAVAEEDKDEVEELRESGEGACDVGERGCVQHPLDPARLRRGRQTEVR